MISWLNNLTTLQLVFFWILCACLTLIALTYVLNFIMWLIRKRNKQGKFVKREDSV
jgi:hypothetical protein